MMGRDEDRAEQVTITVHHDILTNDSSPTQLIESQGNNLKFQHHHLSAPAATGLILTYFIELGVQIYLTISCCGQSVFKISMLLQGDWPAGAYLTMSLALSSLLVSILSMIWVWRGLDFAGRLCGRLLCYALHFFLLGLVWRYLKLVFAPDQADVQEFVGLRIFQAYVQSIPLTSIHLAWLIFAFPESWTPNLSRLVWLVSIEALATVTGLIIAAYIKAGQAELHKIPHQHSTTQIFLENLKCSNKKGGKIGMEEKEHSLWRMWCDNRILSVELNLISRGLLLSARIISIAVLLVHAQYWTPLLVVFHLILSSTWIALTEKKFGKEMLLRGFQISYVLFWDLTCTLLGPLKLSSWAPPAFLVIAENSGLLFLHWYISGPLVGEMDLLVSITAGTCLFVGALLFLGLNLLPSLVPFLNELLCGTRIDRPEDVMECAKTYNEAVPVPQIQQQVALRDFGASSTCASLSLNQSVKLTKNTANSESFNGTGRIRSSEMPINNKGNSNNYEDVIRENQIITPKRNSTERAVEKTRLRPILPDPCPASSSNSPVVPIPPPVSAKWLPDDTCCNDSNNGSWNSRNTNTLMEQDNNEPGVDTLTGTHFVFCYPTKAWTHHDPNNEPDTARRKLLLLNQNSSLSRSVRTPKSRTASPVLIKSASRVVMNRPKYSKESTIRCPQTRPHRQWRKQEVVADSADFRRYPSGPSCDDRLLEDAYGILICETLPGGVRKGSSSALGSIFHVNKKLRVLCAKCLENHDPLLTDCPDDTNWVEIPASRPLPSETTTDYPSSETEVTGDSDRPSSALSSHATTWPHNSHHHHQTNWSKKSHVQSRLQDVQTSMMPRIAQGEFPKEFTSREYVRTWLLTNSLARSRQPVDHPSSAHDRLRVPKRSNTSTSQMRRVAHRINPYETRTRHKRREQATACDIVMESTCNRFEDNLSVDDGKLSPCVTDRQDLVQNRTLPFSSANTNSVCPSPQEALYENDDGLRQEIYHLFFKDLETIL